MKNINHEPEPLSPLALNIPEPDPPALATDLEDSFFETRRLRHDGWDGAKMAAFCGRLAETGIVTYACHHAEMSAQSAYGLRHRNPLFAKAWQLALSMARNRLSDELLARSLKGGAEQLLRDGAIVAERHNFDNKLAFAILRRLDRLAEFGTSFGPRPAAAAQLVAPAANGKWQDLLDALSDNRDEDALVLLAPSKVDSEVDNPPIAMLASESLIDDRVWQEWNSDEWRTNFPPPPDFDGAEDGDWQDEEYSRSLTDDEFAALIAAGRAEGPVILIYEEDVVARDAYFAALAPSASQIIRDAGASHRTEGEPAPAPPSSEPNYFPCEALGLTDDVSPPPLPGKVARSAVGGTSSTFTKPPKPPKSEPPATPARSSGGANKSGDIP